MSVAPDGFVFALTQPDPGTAGAQFIKKA